MKIPGADEAQQHIAAWAAKGRWRDECLRVLDEHFVPACDKAGIDEDELAELLGEHHCRMIQECAFEDFLSRRFDPGGRNIIDDYLDRRAWKESIQGRDYLRALRDSVMSIHEVVEVKPGRSIVLRDLLRGGEPVEVDEQLGSQCMVRWDRIAARILTVAGRHYLSGAVLQFPREAADAVIRIFREAPARAKESFSAEISALAGEDRRRLDEMLSDATIVLGDSAPVIAMIWLAAAIKRLTAPPPALTNFDGEEFAFVKVRFAAAMENRAEIVRILDAAPELSREPEKNCWSWHRHEERPLRQKAESGFSIGTWDESGELVLGRIEIRGKWLTLEVNSAARAERGKRMLMELLGGSIGPPATRTQSVERALAEHRRKPVKDKAPPLPPAEAARMMHEHLDRHYRRLIEEPLPMIGNLSPREAIRTPEGRAKVIEWLKFIENGEARRAQQDGIALYDVAWLWRELGVLEERR